MLLERIGYLLDRYICEQYTIRMIRTFGDPETEKIYYQEKSRKLPPDIQSRALVKLLMIDAATVEMDFRSPPSNHFEHLQGSLKNFCSIRVNGQWRIRFRFNGGDAYDVSIVDYH